MMIKKRLTLFLFIVFFITYVSWGTAALISFSDEGSPWILPLHYLGGSSPLIATLVYLYKTKEWKIFFNRFINFKEVKSYAFFITISPIFIALLTHFIIYKDLKMDPEFIELGFSYVILLLFFGPIPEELGWRGILFNDLNKLSFKKAQIYVSLIWLVWHFPLFFIMGTYQHSLGIFTYSFLFFCMHLILQSLIMGYLFLMGSKNVILPILFHYFVNLFGEMFHKTIVSEMVSIISYMILLFIIMFSYRLTKTTTST